MLTVDFDRLGLRPGERVLDLGCGAGRHAFEMYRRGADVIAFDQDADELSGVRDLFVAMREAGEVPEGAEADVKEGDALALPFADGEFDRVVAAEILEHIPDDLSAIAELVRVTRPGGTVALTVPRWLPEAINWKLSDDYHNVPGGHIRIYTDKELRLQGRERRPGAGGPRLRARPALAVLVDQVCGRRDQRRPPARQGVPQAAGVGDHEAAHGAAVGRSGARPADRQVAGALLPATRTLRSPMSADVPTLDGLLTAPEIAVTARSIAAAQEPSGAIPWSVGEHTDVWNHVESAMGLLAAGEVDAAERAYAWVPTVQRHDGSVPMKIVGGRDRGRQRRDQHVVVPRGRRVAPLADPS